MISSTSYQNIGIVGQHTRKQSAKERRQTVDVNSLLKQNVNSDVGLRFRIPDLFKPLRVHAECRIYARTIDSWVFVQGPLAVSELEITSRQASISRVSDSPNKRPRGEKKNL